MANSSGTQTSTSRPSLTVAGRVVIVFFLFACVGGAFYWARQRHVLPENLSTISSGKDVEIGIAYGTEKQRWLLWAVEQFKATSEGKHIHLNLIPMGSLEGAHAALNGDQRIQVWAPASAVYKSTFVEDWQAKYGSDPILKEDALALTPMVFVMWEERYQAFKDHYGTVDFDTVNRGLHEPGGWQTIGKHADWGLFKFGHTSPGDSNSGILTLLLAGHSYFQKD